MSSEYYLLPFNTTPEALAGVSAEGLAARLRFSLDGLQRGLCSRPAVSCVELGRLRQDDGVVPWLRHILPRLRGPRSSAWLAALKRLGVPHADATSIMHWARGDAPELFLLSESQWRRLLSAGGLQRYESALDVGAGAGDITQEVSPLFHQPVVTTEVGWVAAVRLRLRGFQCVRTTMPQPSHFERSPFDAVFLLNVLDRCKEPLALLRQLRSLVAPTGGRLVVSFPLPTLDLGALAGARTWEDAVTALHDKVLQPAGWQATSVTRAPYLSQGAAHSVNPVFVLDAAVMVLQQKAGPSDNPRAG